MPLRDHFRPPVSKRSSWEGFHGMWPAIIVQKLHPWLPDQYVAEPHVHLGSNFEIDVCAFRDDDERLPAGNAPTGSGAATWAPPRPTLDVSGETLEQYEYAVEIYDLERGRDLVAAIEIVSPANKDREQTRQAFVSKCAALLRRHVCVSIVDLVTERHFNLYQELLECLDQNDPAFDSVDNPTYAATCRLRNNGRPRLETWAYPMEIGELLPTLPLWLNEEQAIPVDLEASYEEISRILKIV